MEQSDADVPFDVDEMVLQSKAPDDATHCVQLVLYLKVDDDRLRDVLETLYTKIMEVDEVIRAGVN